MRSVVALVSSRVHFVLVMTFLDVTYWDCASVDIGEKLSRIPDILWSVGPQCPPPDRLYSRSGALPLYSPSTITTQATGGEIIQNFQPSLLTKIVIS